MTALEVLRVYGDDDIDDEERRRRVGVAKEILAALSVTLMGKGAARVHIVENGIHVAYDGGMARIVQVGELDYEVTRLGPVLSNGDRRTIEVVTCDWESLAAVFDPRLII